MAAALEPVLQKSFWQQVRIVRNSPRAPLSKRIRRSGEDSKEEAPKVPMVCGGHFLWYRQLVQLVQERYGSYLGSHLGRDRDDAGSDPTAYRAKRAKIASRTTPKAIPDVHTGQQVYAAGHRAEWLAKINEPGVRRRAEFYYQQLDALRVLRQQVRRDLLAESKKQPAWKRLCEIPSIAALLGILQTPHRFSHQAAAVDLRWFGH